MCREHPVFSSNQIEDFASRPHSRTGFPPYSFDITSASPANCDSSSPFSVLRLCSHSRRLNQFFEITAKGPPGSCAIGDALTGASATSAVLRINWLGFNSPSGHFNRLVLLTDLIKEMECAVF